MAKYCFVCDAYTNCTDNCKKCIEEFKNEQNECVENAKKEETK